MMPRIVAVTTRFEEQHIPEPNSGCWLYTGYTTQKGYGTFWLAGYPHRAHRAAWLLFRGPLAKDAQVLHRCDNPTCVNPEHLFLGTNADNMRDRNLKHRTRSPLTPEQIRAIRVDKRNYRIVAAEYGVSRSCVHEIRAKRSFRWVL
jgi:hypothetical protein